MHNEPQEDPFQVDESIIQGVEQGHQVETQTQPEYHPTPEARRYPERQRVEPTRLEPTFQGQTYLTEIREQLNE